MAAMNIRSAIAYLGIAIAASGIFVVVRAIEPDRQAHVTAFLGEARRLENGLGLDVLRARLGLIGHYDALARAQRRLRAIATGLKHGPDAIFGLGDADIDDAVTAYQHHAGRLETLVEDFKSDNAIAFNSVHYVPTVAAEARAVATRTGVTPAFLLVIDDVHRTVFEFRAEGGRAVGSRLRRAIDRLDPTLVPTSVGLAEPVALLRAHALNVLDYGSNADRAAAAVVALVSTDAAGRALTAYQAFEGRRYARVQTVAASLAALSVVFLGLIAIAFGNLRQARLALGTANDTLEDEVAARTRELMAAKIEA